MASKFWTLAPALLLTTVFLVPAAPAAAGPACPADGKGTGLVDVWVNGDCTVEVEILSGLACLWDHRQKTVSKHGVTITYNYCGNGQDTYSAGGAGECEGTTKSIPSLFGESELTYSKDCAHLELHRGIICLGGSVERTDIAVGPASATLWGCGNPNQGGGPLDKEIA